jgi:ATP-binding cassette subfamily B protein
MRKGIAGRLLKIMRPHIHLLALSVISAAINVLFSLYVPILIGRGVDMVISAGAVHFDTLAPILAQIAVSVGISAFFSWLLSYLSNLLSYKTARDMRVMAFDSLQSAPLSYIDRNPQGDIASRIINDIDQVSDGLLQGFSQLLSGVMTIAGTLVFMLSINSGIALFVVLLTPVSLITAWFIARQSYKTFSVQMKERGELNSYAEEIINGHDVVQSFSYGEQALAEFDGINARMHRSGVKSQFYSSLTNPSTRLVSAFIYAGVAILGALSAISGGITVGNLSSFLMYANQYMKPFNEISSVVTEMQAAFASAGRVFDIIDAPPEPSDTAGTAHIDSTSGNVVFDDVSFSYSPDKKLIEGFNLYAASGQRVAIVGPTGSGKTTLMNLLMRFYEVDSGGISIDGADIRSIGRDNLRSLYGMVLQDTWLFTGTVKENIAFGRPDASDDEITQAAKRSGAHSFIRRLPQGYATMLTERRG